MYEGGGGGGGEKVGGGGDKEMWPFCNGNKYK